MAADQGSLRFAHISSGRSGSSHTQGHDAPAAHRFPDFARNPVMPRFAHRFLSKSTQPDNV
jgi:hypothetical protein